MDFTVRRNLDTEHIIVDIGGSNILLRNIFNSKWRHICFSKFIYNKRILN